MMCLVLLHPLFFFTVNQEPTDVYGVKKINHKIQIQIQREFLYVEFVSW